MRGSFALLALGLVMLALAGQLFPAPADAAGYTPADSVDAINLAAARYGVSAPVMLAVARCESDLDPDAVGDRGRSHGLYQLNDRATGLLAHFHAVSGDASAYNPYASARYFARVLAGHFAGVGPSRWTCWRMVMGR